MVLACARMLRETLPVFGCVSLIPSSLKWDLPNLPNSKFSQIFRLFRLFPMSALKSVVDNF